VHSDDQDNLYFFLRELTQQRSDQSVSFRLNVKRKQHPVLPCQGLNLSFCKMETCELSFSFVYVECQPAVSDLDAHDHHLCLAITDISERKLAQKKINCLNEKLEQKIIEQTHELTNINADLQKKIKELALSEHQILEREAKLNAIFNAAIEGIITINETGIIVSLNSATETIFGYRQEELIGSKVTKIIPDDKEHNHDKHFLNHLTHVLGQIRNVDGKRKDGSIVPLDISIANFSIDGSQYFTSIVRDVSSRKLKELEDKMHVDELAHVTRLGLMGEMASGIAHEVNQPLTAIANYAQACLNFLQDKSPDLLKIGEILEKTNQQALKAGQIIHRMRDFVSFKTSHRSSVDINELINTCLSFCNNDLQINGIKLTLNLAHQLPLVSIDSVQIEQVLLNLIRNSLDALLNLPDNKIRELSIQTEINAENNIVIRLKDNGPGIPLNDQEKILKPFYTTKKAGMGMGLCICQSIVKAHDGALSFNSIPGKGTTFYFTLPFLANEAG
jgi:PAS domain S-box-containing protein